MFRLWLVVCGPVVSCMPCGERKEMCSPWINIYIRENQNAILNHTKPINIQYIKYNLHKLRFFFFCMHVIANLAKTCEMGKGRKRSFRDRYFRRDERKKNGFPSIEPLQITLHSTSLHFISFFFRSREKKYTYTIYTMELYMMHVIIYISLLIQ